MDALAHNVESYLSPAYHPLCDGIALEGARVAARALRPAVREGKNLEARSDMLMASMMGAIAFQKDLGAVHSCAHSLGTVQRLRGGVCAVRNGKVLASVALPIAGLLSDKRAPVVAKETTALKRAWTKLHCKVPYMGFNLLPLSVIPDLRLTDKGLIDVRGMRVLPLFESDSSRR